MGFFIESVEEKQDSMAEEEHTRNKNIVFNDEGVDAKVNISLEKKEQLKRAESL